MTAINRYDEHGQPQGALAGRFGYTGQMWLPELSLWHYKARAYHPGLGRLMQPDPIGYQAGMNLYAYVGGDPVNATDPMGLISDDEIIVTGYRCSGRCYKGDEFAPFAPVPFGGLAGGSGVGLAGGGDSDSGEGPEGEREAEIKKFCDALKKADTGQSVSPFVRNSPEVWNDTSQLQFHMDYANRQAASNEAFGVAFGVGSGGVEAAAFRWRSIGKIVASKAAAAVGLFGAAVALGTSLSASAQRQAANSIGARIQRLNAIKAGICPGS